MSEQPAPGAVPEWDIADRMRKSLRHAGIGVQQMADYLDVDRSTVSTWINGRITPSTQTLRLWALRCGVDYAWLTGKPDRPATLRPAKTGSIIGTCWTLQHNLGLAA